MLEYSRCYPSSINSFGCTLFGIFHTNAGISLSLNCSQMYRMNNHIIRMRSVVILPEKMPIGWCHIDLSNLVWMNVFTCDSITEDIST